MKNYKTIYEGNGHRITEHLDNDYDFENLIGDSYDPKHNPDISPDILAEQLKDFTDLVNREGVYGYVLEKWNPAIGEGWTTVDSCWGFVGAYLKGDPTFEHCIVDDMIRIAEGSKS